MIFNFDSKIDFLFFFLSILTYISTSKIFLCLYAIIIFFNFHIFGIKFTYKYNFYLTSSTIEWIKKRVEFFPSSPIFDSDIFSFVRFFALLNADFRWVILLPSSRFNSLEILPIYPKNYLTTTSRPYWVTPRNFLSFASPLLAYFFYLQKTPISEWYFT